VTAARLGATVALATAAAVLFIILATANSGGYRYGVSDQAYYIPAIQHRLDPDLFPRDTAMLDAQSQLITSDQLMAALVDSTSSTLPTVAAAFYVVSLLVLLGATVAYTRALHYSWWAVAAGGLLLTLRHRIAKTGANSLEGYMHPRQLAFGIGVAALACVLRDRFLPAAGLVVVAAVLHPTTALWFGLAVAVAAFVKRPDWRWPLTGLGVVGALVSVWLVTVGPLAGRLVAMDSLWLRVLGEKDYLFPTDWPLDAWLINLAYPVVIYLTWRARVTRGVAVAGESALVWAGVALLAVFAVSVPLTAADIAFAVQLQITRVFWVLDFVALMYAAWWLTRSPRWAVAAVVILATASAARGYYLLEVWQPDRELVTVELPDTQWMEAMLWLRAQPEGWHVLADPDHAWKYGISVRVAARKDTVLESIKDSAIALYDRDVAVRVSARTQDLIDFDRMTDARARMLADRYAADVIIVESAHILGFPELYRNAQFVIYDLR